MYRQNQMFKKSWLTRCAPCKERKQAHQDAIFDGSQQSDIFEEVSFFRLETQCYYESRAVHTQIPLPRKGMLGNKYFITRN